MSFVTLPEAKLHLRGVDGTEEDALIGVYITAAEQMAIALLDRGVYADGTALGLLLECHRRGLRRGQELRLVALDERGRRLLRRLALRRHTAAVW